MRKKILNSILFLVGLYLLFWCYNAVMIYNYAQSSSNKHADVALVLGAGISDERVSPVFKERLNHAIHLYQEGRVAQVILTGGKGEQQKQADSEVAKYYLLQNGVPEKDIYTDTLSKYTHKNLSEAEKIMRKNGFTSALIVSDPLHMKRAMYLTQRIAPNCYPSPTPSSMYKSFLPKAKSLFYESFFLSLSYLRYGF
ncbi:YdcF family protein [Lishizhenia sp.]|uniref:YdcF family protein n=1 Tax=Lishizhenia sp. TaxID=2497594 RepID=UPI00299E1E3F|nr:YdcF family protein [Lishizhenia sp.]